LGCDIDVTAVFRFFSVSVKGVFIFGGAEGVRNWMWLV